MGIWLPTCNVLCFNPQMKGYQSLVHELRVQYAYPRLDVNVTKGINHLLKSPLCVHPKTGMLSITSVFMDCSTV